MKTPGVNNADSCCKEAVQFSASFVASLFAVFDEIYATAMTAVFFVRVTVIKILGNFQISSRQGLTSK